MPAPTKALPTITPARTPGADPALGPCEPGVVHPYAQPVTGAAGSLGQPQPRCGALRAQRGKRMLDLRVVRLANPQKTISDCGEFRPQAGQRKSCSFAQPTRRSGQPPSATKGFPEAPGVGWASRRRRVRSCRRSRSTPGTSLQRGHVAPTRGQGYMMVEAIEKRSAKAAPRSETDDPNVSKPRRTYLYSLRKTSSRLSLYNLSFMRTFNLQKLADTGTVFDRAYCQQ